MAKNLPIHPQHQYSDLLDRPLRQFPNLWSFLFPLSEQDFGSFLTLSGGAGARIYEENNQLHVELPFPGLNPKDIEVTFSKGVLFIKGESSEEEKDKKRKYYQSSTRKYSFSYALPSHINDKQEPEATYEDGILKVSLHLDKQKETKKITVKSNNNKKNKWILKDILFKKNVF